MLCPYIAPVPRVLVSACNCADAGYYCAPRSPLACCCMQMNIGVSVIVPNDFDALQTALDTHKTTLFFSESPTNPYLRCVDIERISKMCHAKVSSCTYGRRM